MDDLEKLRGKLDEVDRRLLEVLGERLQTVAEIARVKAQGVPFLRDHDRESELLARIEGWARELGLDGFRTHEIYREIIAMSLKAQEEALLKRDQVERSTRGALRVAFQGIEGSYSQLAARKYFAARANGMEFVGTHSFAEALAMAESGEVGYAFLPVENTTAGSINQTYDLRRVLSHPQALAQCSRFLDSLENVELVAFVDTAASAREVSLSDDLSQAAIASAEAGEIYGLTVLREAIADQEENWTRFVVISGLEIELDRRIPAKTSLVFTTPHREGALAHCLHLLAKHGVNLTKLESRPVPRRPWEYLFYADVEGALVSDDVALAIAELRRECPYLRVLGSYPARTTAAGAVDRYSEDED